MPTEHRLPTTPAVPPPPGITRVSSLEELHRVVETHVERTVDETGDWRAAVDGLRPVTAQLWQGLSDDEKRRFVGEYARTWDVHRHRMPPITARRLTDIAEAGRMVRHTGTVASAHPLADGVEVTLTDGSQIKVAGVVNCTGPVGTLGKDPLLVTLARTGLVRPGPSGLGIDTADDGRVLGVLPARMPFYALGALRRGNLWETTAMPEIREQAYDVARAVVRALHGETKRRPVDVYGLTLTTGRRAAEVYNEAFGRLLRLQDGVETGLEAAVAVDPEFAQAHAALALLRHEWGAAGSWRDALRTAHSAAANRHLDDREVSFLDAVTVRLRSDEATGAAALLRHVRLFPRDALAVSVAVPTVAFGGLTSGEQTAELVEGLGRTYGDDWWYAGQLAFVRQDQERWREAEALSSYALSVEPSSGHAAHARAHVFYETGEHTAGLAWLDDWIRTRGPEANHRSHFSWHAALHELMQCDIEAVRRRYERELSPPEVTGSRALVDSGALLWRCHVTDAWDGPLPSGSRLRLRPGRLADHPAHAVRCPALGTQPGGGGRRGRAGGPVDDFAGARRSLLPRGRGTGVPRPQGRGRRRLPRRGEGAQCAIPRASAMGGSAAQRDVLQDTLVYALARSGQGPARCPRPGRSAQSSRLAARCPATRPARSGTTPDRPRPLS